MIYIKRLIGAILYSVFKHFSLRFILPKNKVRFIEQIRTQALVLQGAEIGSGSVIRDNVFIAFPRNLVIGNNVTIGPYSKIFNYSDFIVGNDTEIGPGLHVQTNDHIWSDNQKPLGKQGAISAGVKIGEGVFIGANVTILMGVIVEKLCVVSAGSVVVRNLESGWLYGGVPAKRIQAIKTKKD